jgi:ABC-type nitrate/sulfonate/bicarbonate transport system substrate-binding protein
MKLNFINLRDEDKALDYYTPVIITSEKNIADNPELVKKFMKATSKGYQFAIKNPDQAAQILIKNVPEINKTLVQKSQKYMADQYQADAKHWGEMKPEVWQNYTDFMINYKLLEKNIDVNKAFTNDFLTE